MPIIGRRSLQLMLDELQGIFIESKSRDIRNRIESPSPDQALPAEYELAVTWAVSKVSTIEPDRPVASGKTPDIYAEGLIDTAPIHLEIVAIGDAALGGMTEMRRAGNILNDAADRIRPGARNHLHYEFKEESGYQAWERGGRRGTKYYRQRLITHGFALTSEIEEQLGSWLTNYPPRRPLVLQNEHIHVVVTWREHRVHPQLFVFSSLPAIAYDIRDNPLFKALNNKKRQLRSAPEGVMKGIVVGDAGSHLLTDIDSKSQMTFSGRDIINAFLKKADVDLVLVFVPRQRHPNLIMLRNQPMGWCLYVFDPQERLSNADKARLEAARAALPIPSYYGYQARSGHEQEMFDPQARGQYLGSEWSAGRKRMRVKTSARAVHDYLAGRITAEQFRYFTSASQPNLFDTALRNGMTLRATSIEPAGTGEDDDYIVFEFATDAAATELEVRGAGDITVDVSEPK